MWGLVGFSFLDFCRTCSKHYNSVCYLSFFSTRAISRRRSHTTIRSLCVSLAFSKASFVLLKLQRVQEVGSNFPHESLKSGVVQGISPDFSHWTQEQKMNAIMCLNFLWTDFLMGARFMNLKRDILLVLMIEQCYSDM